mgnify:CR=1 FL=1
MICAVVRPNMEKKIFVGDFQLSCNMDRINTIANKYELFIITSQELVEYVTSSPKAGMSFETQQIALLGQTEVMNNGQICGNYGWWGRYAILAFIERNQAQTAIKYQRQ